MKKYIILFLAMFTMNIAFGQIGQTQYSPQFNGNTIVSMYNNEAEVQDLDIQIIVNTKDDVLQFITPEDDWTEVIAQKDTIFDGRTRTIQLWTETAYWEIKQYNTGMSKVFRPYMVIEYPYLGQVDKRIYSRKKQSSTK